MKHPLDLFQYCPECGSSHFEVNNEKSKKCTDCGFVYYFNPSSATVALILNDQNELLVCRRAKEPAKGTLDLPGPTGFTVTVRNVKVSAGAGFLVALTGEIMTMPGLPKVPAAERIDVDEDGKISGLF